MFAFTLLHTMNTNRDSFTRLPCSIQRGQQQCPVCSSTATQSAMCSLHFAMPGAQVVTMAGRRTYDSSPLSESLKSCMHSLWTRSR